MKKRQSCRSSTRRQMWQVFMLLAGGGELTAKSPVAAAFVLALTAFAAVPTAAQTVTISASSSSGDRDTAWPGLQVDEEDEIEVYYTLTGVTGGVTIDRSASGDAWNEDDVDNYGFTSTVEFASGTTQVTDYVWVWGDGEEESDETITFTIDGIHTDTTGQGVIVGTPSSVTVTIRGVDTAPDFGTRSVPAKNLLRNRPIAEFQIPAATGGNGGVTYTVSNLPAGLVFDADGTGSCPGAEPREICGTPTGGGGTVTVTAADADSNTASSDAATLTFTVSLTDVALASDPDTLSEANLDGARLTVTLLSGITFAGGVSASSFALVASPPIAGLAIASVSGGASGATTATLTLETGAGYGINRPTTIAVRVLAAAHSGGGDLTSVALSVAPPINIPDARLRLLIEGTLGKMPGESISRAEMQHITVILGSALGITNLTGLEYATNMRQAFFTNNHISDISPLQDLSNLERLVLNGNSISDISPLINARRLTTLELNGNRISDITPLAGLTRLIELDLGGNRISDISRLEDMIALASLDLGDNYISDITPLAGLTRLVELDLGSNRISDIASLAGLTGLVELDLGSNRISDIASLAGLTGLVELDLGSNRISDIASLAGLTRLVELDLGENHLSDIAPLADLIQIRRLLLNGNQILDIAPLLMNKGLNDGDNIDLHDNVLDDESNRIHLSTLRNQGVSIVNDTAISVVPQASALEGENIEFRVSLSAPVEFDLKIIWDILALDAKEIEDFASEDATGMLSIKALDIEGIILVRTTEDDQSEQDETFDLFIDLPLGSEPPVGVMLNQLFGTGTILDDDRPIAREVAPNQKLAAGDNALKLELSSLFFSPSELIYEAVSSDASMAQVRISGDLLIIRPEGAGEVTITITATDGHGFKATQAFTLTIEPTAPRSHLRGWRLSLLMGDQKKEV